MEVINIVSETGTDSEKKPDSAKPGPSKIDGTEASATNNPNIDIKITADNSDTESDTFMSDFNIKRFSSKKDH